MTGTVVRTVEVSPGRWSACIAYQDRDTSFSCAHLHHSPHSADQCHRRTLRAWDAFPLADLRTIQTEPWTIHELRRGSTTRRFRFLDEDPV